MKNETTENWRRTADNILKIFDHTIDNGEKVQKISIYGEGKNLEVGVQAADGTMWVNNPEFSEELNLALKKVNGSLEEEDREKMKEFLREYCDFEEKGFGVTYISLKD